MPFCTTQMAQTKEHDRTRLTDEEFERIFAMLKMIRGIYTGTPIQCRCFVEAILWVLRVGGQWRSLPPDRGNWNSVFKRFSHRSKLGVWNQLHEFFAEPYDLQDVFIDGTIAGAHACAAGAAKSCAEDESLGSSRGGFGCKIHAAADGLALPIKFILTGRQAADVSQAIPLMTGISAQACLAE